MNVKAIALTFITCVLGGCATPPPRNARDSLAAITISEVDFRQTSIPDAITFINDAQRAGSTPRVPLILDPSVKSITNTVTLAAVDISAWQAVQIIAQDSGLWLQTHPDKLVLSRRCCPGQTSPGLCPRLETRRYQSRDVVESFLRHRDDPNGIQPARQGETLDAWSTAFLAKLGVKWHEGSSFVMNTNTFVITVTNTPVELDNFESIVTISDVDGWPKFKRLREAQPGN